MKETWDGILQDCLEQDGKIVLLIEVDNPNHSQNRWTVRVPMDQQLADRIGLFILDKVRKVRWEERAKARKED